MDGDRFDALSRVLGSGNGTTRRGVIALLGGVAGMASLPVDPATAGQRKRKHAARKRRKRRKNAQANPSPQPQGSGNKPNGRGGSVCVGEGTRPCDPSQAGPGLDLSQCNFAGAGFVGASLSGIAATRANFAGAHTFGADLASANLDGACFANASLRNANLRGANAAEADFAKADLCGADLRGANISSTQIAAARVCCGVGCVDLANDPLSCGTCGHACAAGEVCCAGQCAPPVPGGRCVEGDVKCLTHDVDLQAAIDAAPDGSTIFLCEGTWDLKDRLLIDKDLQIHGGWNGGTSTLDCGSNNQVLGIATYKGVSITNVTIRGGFAQYGAGIFNQGALSLGDCAIIENSSFGYGGGIYNEGVVRIVRGTVEENSAYNAGFDYGGYGIYNDEGSVLVQGASISFNKSIGETNGGDGAGVYNYYGLLDLTSDSAITENETTGAGGGIYNDGGTVSLPSTSLVTGNRPNNCAGSAVANCVG